VKEWATGECEPRQSMMLSFETFAPSTVMNKSAQPSSKAAGFPLPRAALFGRHRFPPTAASGRV
jgi:hypothetical protein